MSEPFAAELACGCRLAFRKGTDGSPVLVVIARKADTCTMPLHVGGLPVYDHRSALRPSTRFSPSLQPDFEDS